MEKKLRAAGLALLAAAWLGISVWAWCKPTTELSVSERRRLAQRPHATWASVLSGGYMSDFDSYAMDQFPMREALRRLKAAFSYGILKKKDSGGVYLAEGYAAALDYPLNMRSIQHATDRFQAVYDTYLENSGSRILAAIVPDKSYYLAERNGYPCMDYDALFSAVEAGMPWAEFVDLTDTLTLESYYRTDAHWRQEMLLPTAQKLAQALDILQPQAADYTQTPLERPFTGVYAGRAALPMAADTIVLMTNPLLDACTVQSAETDAVTAIYDMAKCDSLDLYDVYLSGAAALLTVENPYAETERELVVFRDSFGSSLVPLLVHGYRRVTLVDLRYIGTPVLGDHLTFSGQDVLFLYSTSVLNSSGALK